MIIRIMGFARQSVQRTADELEEAKLVAFIPNPHHKRAMLMVLTEEGRWKFEQVMARQVPWVNALARDIEPREIERTTWFIGHVTELLNRRVGEP